MSKESSEGQYHYESDYALGESPLAPIAHRAYVTFSTFPDDSWVADLGCGSGRFALHAPKPRSYRVFGVDLSANAIASFKEAVSLDGRLDEAMAGDITDLSWLPARAFKGAISWRVLHSLRPHQQRQALVQIRQVLPVGAPFFLAVASDTDWKAGELQERGIYVADGLNDCGRIMGLQRPFLVHFFNQESLVRLLVAMGFSVKEIAPFQEATGYKRLRKRHPLNDYLYAHAARI